MIQRIFHPIGQGAFYSERHNNFNIVYDCGNWKNSKLADKVVQNSFHPGDEIEILFISHFDYDHVSKIDTLKGNFRIKKVVLPLLHDDEKIFLVNLFNNLGLINVSELINNPTEYFGSDTIIMTVSISENSEGENVVETIQVEDITAREIRSGTVLKCDDWVFIPYNFHYSSRGKELENLFAKKGLDIIKFKEEVGYLIQNRKSIKDIYEKVTGGINQNSMLVYSGPIKGNKHLVSSHHIYHKCHLRRDMFYCERHHNFRNRAGCIYTGDADLNVSSIDLIYKQNWGNVGTIQIPHHGDINSFNKNVLSNNNYYCPISVGTNNSYGHPSNQMMADVIYQHSCPILITEKLDSGFFQIIQ